MRDFFLSIFFEHNFEKFGFVTIWLFVKDAFLVDVWGVLKPAIHPFRGDSNFSQLFGNRGDFPLRLVDWWAFCNLSVAPFELVSVLDFNRVTGPHSWNWFCNSSWRTDVLSFFYYVMLFCFWKLSFCTPRLYASFLSFYLLTFCFFYSVILHGPLVQLENGVVLLWCRSVWPFHFLLFYFDVAQFDRFICYCFDNCSRSISLPNSTWLASPCSFWTAHVNICQWNKKMYRCKLHVY